MFKFHWSGFKTKFIFLVGIFIISGLGQAVAYDDAECIDCHKKGSKKSNLTMDVTVFRTSIHAAGFKCADCHKGALTDQHLTKPGSGRVDCLICHKKVNRHGNSDKGRSRPRCIDCHTRHRIFSKFNPASSVHVDRMSTTCQGCHPEESGKPGYLSWLPSLRIESHSKQNLGTENSLNNCLGCHQGAAAHGETKNISTENCHQCHLKQDGKSILLGKTHMNTDPKAQPRLFVVAFIYQFSVILLIWGGVRWFLRRK
ncbi:MAG: hypothetical protein HQ517_01455 [SAR324 cluster bacterium]|nr:hypothetical protein [SAR324 cluster bacterium]